MEKIKAWFKGIVNDDSGDVYHVDVLDGIRALSVLIVLWFHYWQQTWLMPYYATPFLEWMGITQINPDLFRRAGYLFVDMMVLVSAFSLFLPHARTMVMGEKVPSIKRFYLKRAARILPSYYLCVIFLFILGCIKNLYPNQAAFMVKDLVTHLTFTQMFWQNTYIFTNLNVVLWTIAVLVMFYAIFPWIAALFRKLPLLIYCGLVLVGLAVTYWFTTIGSQMNMYVNQFPTFLPVFANGMAAAYLYVWFTKKCRWRRILAPLFTAAVIILLIGLLHMMKQCIQAYPNSQKWQMEWRYILSLVFTGIILFSAFAVKPFRWLLSNSLMKGIAAISFNLYIWHQWIMVELRNAMNFSSGADVSAAGANTQLAITITAVIISILVATFLTYCVERPLSKLIMRIGKNKVGKENKDALSVQDEGNLLVTD